MNDPHESAPPGPPAYVPTLTEVVVLPSGANAPAPAAVTGGAGMSGPDRAASNEPWRQDLQVRLAEALGAALQASPPLAQLDRQALLEAARACLPQALDLARSMSGPRSTFP